MADIFTARGAVVALVDVDRDAVVRVADAIAADGRAALAIEADVSDAAAVLASVERVEAELGPIDVLCSNAGVLDGYASVTETSVELWSRVLAVNLTGVFHTAHSVLPFMVERGRGVIVNTASISGLVAGGGGAAYTAAKHGVIGLTRQICFDYAHLGIRANAICPGPVETGMTRDLFASGDAAVMQTVRSVPAGRTATAEEIANVAAFLAGDESSFIHGAAIVADGGWTVR